MNWESLPGLSNNKTSANNIHHGGAWLAFAVDGHRPCCTLYSIASATYNTLGASHYKYYTYGTFQRDVYYIETPNANAGHQFVATLYDGRTAKLNVTN